MWSESTYHQKIEWYLIQNYRRQLTLKMLPLKLPYYFPLKKKSYLSKQKQKYMKIFIYLPNSISQSWLQTIEKRKYIPTEIQRFKKWSLNFWWCSVGISFFFRGNSIALTLNKTTHHYYLILYVHSVLSLKICKHILSTWKKKKSWRQVLADVDNISLEFMCTQILRAKD